MVTGGSLLTFFFAGEVSSSTKYISFVGSPVLLLGETGRALFCPSNDQNPSSSIEGDGLCSFGFVGLSDGA